MISFCVVVCPIVCTRTSLYEEHDVCVRYCRLCGCTTISLMTFCCMVPPYGVNNSLWALSSARIILKTRKIVVSGIPLLTY